MRSAANQPGSRPAESLGFPARPKSAGLGHFVVRKHADLKLRLENLSLFSYLQRLVRSRLVIKINW